MLRGIVEALEKADQDNPELVRMIDNLKPLLFQSLSSVRIDSCYFSR